MRAHLPPPALPDVQVSWQPCPRRAGAGLTLACGRFESPFGPVEAMGTGAGLWGLAFAREIGPEAARADLARRWPQARLVEAPETLAPWVRAAFASATGQGVAVVATGSAFDHKVWQALLAIPPGQVRGYGALARTIGQPEAARAVGGALGRNTLALLIPCHRVVPASGGPGGYRWGPALKRDLLGWEQARAPGLCAGG